MDGYNINGNNGYGHHGQPSFITYKDFYRRVIGKGSKTTILAFVILLYINSGLVLGQMFLVFVGLLFGGNAVTGITAYQVGFYLGQALIPMVFYLVLGILGILVHVNKNWILSLIVTCIFGINVLIVLATEGTMIGVAVFILGIGSTVILYKMKKAYNLYITQGIWPSQYI